MYLLLLACYCLDAGPFLPPPPLFWLGRLTAALFSAEAARPRKTQAPAWSCATCTCCPRASRWPAGSSTSCWPATPPTCFLLIVWLSVCCYCFHYSLLIDCLFRLLCLPAVPSICRNAPPDEKYETTPVAISPAP